MSYEAILDSIYSRESSLASVCDPTMFQKLEAIPGDKICITIGAFQLLLDTKYTQHKFLYGGSSCLVLNEGKWDVFIVSRVRKAINLCAENVAGPPAENFFRAGRYCIAYDTYQNFPQVQHIFKKGKND